MEVKRSLPGRRFEHPVLEEGDCSDPGIIKIDDIYYIITSTKDNSPKKFPIHKSTDLINWKLVGHIFNKSNVPRWSDELQPFLSAKIHKIGCNYHVYFTATDSTTAMQSIGVAIAHHPEGPYVAIDRPLLSNPGEHVKDASVAEDSGNLYLIWVTRNVIRGRMLNINGLSFYATYSTELISSKPGVTSIGGPWYTTRGSHHYLIYSQNDYCNQTLHLARSSYPLGPYEDQNLTISDSSVDFKGVGHASLVKDLDDTSDIMVYHAFRKNEVGSAWPRVILLASVSWTEIRESQTEQVVISDDETETESGTSQSETEIKELQNEQSVTNQSGTANNGGQTKQADTSQSGSKINGSQTKQAVTSQSGTAINGSQTNQAVTSQSGTAINSSQTKQAVTSQSGTAINGSQTKQPAASQSATATSKSQAKQILDQQIRTAMKNSQIRHTGTSTFGVY